MSEPRLNSLGKQARFKEQQETTDSGMGFVLSLLHGYVGWGFLHAALYQSVNGAANCKIQLHSSMRTNKSYV
jgi:hypothetical protein